MSTFKTTLALGLLLLTNACGASTVTASSRSAGGGAMMGVGLGPIGEHDNLRNVEQPMFDRQPSNRDQDMVRERPAFRIESDCWRCR